MKRIILLSLILALSVTGCAFGASSEAIINVVGTIPASYQDIYDNGGYDDNGNVVVPAYATTLEEALDRSDGFTSDASAFENVTIVLQKNETPESTIELDGSNYGSLRTITITGSGTRTISMPESEGRHFIVSSSGVKLILTNIVLKGSTSGGGVSISDGECEFNTVTFTSNVSTEEDDDSNTRGGAVALTGAGKATFNGCTLSSNEAANGGAIYAASTGKVTFTGTNTFTNNQATSTGGAIYLSPNADVSYDGTFAFNTNSAENGGAVYLSEGSSNRTLTIGGSFTGNSASASGGALYISNGRSVEFTGTVTFDNNSAEENGGAVYVTGSGKLNASNSTVTFSNNKAAFEDSTDPDDPDTGFGGGLCMLGTETLTFGTVTFRQNQAGLGGGVYTSGGTINFAGTTTIGTLNKAYNGGGLYINGGAVNFTSSEGAGITANEALNNGGGLYIAGTGSSVNFTTEPTFSTNKANSDNGESGDGGAIWWGLSVSDFPSSGTFDSNTTSGTYQNSEVAGDAGKGGALYIAGTSTKETLNITSGYTFSRNNAFNKGGAIYIGNANVSVLVDGADISAVNTARYFNGGFICAESSTVTISNSKLYNQTAGNNGGAVYAAEMTITSSDFTSNSAVIYGGAVCVTKGSNSEAALTVQDTSFTANRATDRDRGIGGAIGAITADSVTITNSYFLENAAGDSGGAIFTDQDCKNITITTSTFTRNGSDGSSVNAKRGGAIRTDSSIEITRSYFANNNARNDGGAIYFERHNNSGKFTLEYSMFRNNTAAGNYGGAVYVWTDEATIGRSTFSANSVMGSSKVRGGAIYIKSQRESSIQNCTFTDNQASGSDSYGGGVALDGPALVRITSCTFTASSSQGNRAQSGGGGIYISSTGNIDIGGTIVVGNTSDSGMGDDIYSDADADKCSSSSLGFNRVGKFAGKNGIASWTTQSNRSATDRSSESWTKSTFFTTSVLDDNIIDSEHPPVIGSTLADEGQIRLQTIMLSEDITLEDDNRATNIIDTSYSASFPRYDERGADRWATGAALDIGAVMFDGTVPGPGPAPIDSYTIASVMISGIPNTLRSIGQTASLIAFIRYTNGRTAYGGDDTGSEPVTWSSSNQNIVRIDQKGNITALATTPNNSYVTITVSTKRNSSTGSPATDSRPVRVLGQYSYLNVSSVYQNYFSQYNQELAEHDIALSLADVNSSSVKSTSFQRSFKAAWEADSASQITDLTSSTPSFNTLTSYNASGYTPSKRAAANINFQNRSNGDVFPLVYSWTFSGSEIKSLLGYDLSQKTLNANLADELFKSLRIDFQGASRTFQVVGGSGVSAKDAYTNQALTMTKADGNKGVNISLTAYLANVNASGNDSDGPQLMGSGSRKLLVVPDGTNDGAITGSMWMIQKGSSSGGGDNDNPSPNPNPSPDNNNNSGSGGGGGGGCSSLGLGLLGLLFIFRRR